MTRHLLYYVHPRTGPVWRANVAALLERVDRFDGVRAAVVGWQRDPVPSVRNRPGYTLDDPAEVEALLKPHGFSVEVVRNDPDGGECVGFRPLWNKLRGVPAADVAFYAHAKGVTHPVDSCVHRWTALLYAANLDYPELVDGQFRMNKAVVGSFRQAAGLGPRDRFIFAGTFYWVRVGRVFSKPLWHRACGMRYAGVELWPGRLFRPDESGCVFKHYPPGLQAYDPAWVDATAREFRAWSIENVAFRRPAATAEPWVPYERSILEGSLECAPGQSAWRSVTSPPTSTSRSGRSSPPSPC